MCNMGNKYLNITLKKYYSYTEKSECSLQEIIKNE